MANILTDYNLTGGDTRSSEISSATYLEFQALLTTVVGRVDFQVQKKLSTGDWVAVTDGNSKPIIMGTNDSVERGLNIQSLSGDSIVSIYVKVYPEATGTISIATGTDGTIA